MEAIRPPLALDLDTHADAEEEILYPHLLTDAGPGSRSIRRYGRRFSTRKICSVSPGNFRPWSWSVARVA
ncbi:hypothetical protein GCM10009557_71960 [Virgisporangium ochraceum]